ncbi:hypothetical protein L596_010321 [Steinernema carpocapsae]|uniref:Uncharacterized protein n=1 Tax=Steinernema carpocapsae TaxID=34508 RepID=A0A4V6A704_STECR|nr:hypothetical protein L596_010321 [Steinernema carpocapsae]
MFFYSTRRFLSSKTLKSFVPPTTHSLDLLPIAEIRPQDVAYLNCQETLFCRFNFMRPGEFGASVGGQKLVVAKSIKNIYIREAFTKDSSKSQLDSELRMLKSVVSNVVSLKKLLLSLDLTSPMAQTFLQKFQFLWQLEAEAVSVVGNPDSSKLGLLLQWHVMFNSRLQTIELENADYEVLKMVSSTWALNVGARDLLIRSYKGLSEASELDEVRIMKHPTTDAHLTAYMRQ